MFERIIWFTLKTIFILGLYLWIYNGHARLAIHELGHAQKASQTAKLLGLEEDDYHISYRSDFLSGRTYTDVYTYLTEHRSEKDIQKLIKANLYAGYINELRVLLFILVISAVASSLPAIIANIAYMICVTYHFYTDGEDYQLAKDPANWVYDPNREP